MSDRAGLISEPIFCKQCAGHFLSAATEACEETTTVADGLLVAGYFRDSSYYGVMERAKDLVDALRRRICHPVRFAFIGEHEMDDVLTFNATPYTAEDYAAQEAELAARRAEMQAELDHRAAVLAEAEANEVKGPLPIDAFLNR